MSRATRTVCGRMGCLCVAPFANATRSYYIRRRAPIPPHPTLKHIRSFNGHATHLYTFTRPLVHATYTSTPLHTRGVCERFQNGRALVVDPTAKHSATLPSHSVETRTHYANAPRLSSPCL